MTAVVFKYIDDIIPYGLEASSNKLEFLYTDNLGKKMLAYIQQLRLANQKRLKGGPRCKVNITWTPTNTPIQLSCVWDPVIMGKLPSSTFMTYLNLYLKNVVQWRMYYNKRSRGLFGYKPSYP